MNTETKKRHKRFTRTHRRRGGTKDKQSTDSNTRSKSKSQKWSTRKNLNKVFRNKTVQTAIAMLASAGVGFWVGSKRSNTEFERGYKKGILDNIDDIITEYDAQCQGI